MKKIIKFLERIEPDKKKSPFLHTVFDGFHTFLFAPNSVTGSTGVQIRDGMDLKRQMVFVVIAMQLCYLFGTYNIGHQHFAALGMYTDILDFQGIHLKLAYGIVQLLPIFVVAHIVGLGVEFFYAAKKGHPIEEGFLVSGALIPLIMPPDLPLWILALAVLFAVIIGKEAFGGTGMNILNIALLARVFVFFAYPTTISGDEAWVAGLTQASEGGLSQYGTFETYVHEWILNPTFSMLGLDQFAASGTQAVVDGYTGATPLSLAFQGGWAAVENPSLLNPALSASSGYTFSDILWGWIPGSIGETSKPLIIIGGIMLLVTRIASWRIMLSMLVGGYLMALIMNGWGATEFMTVPAHYQIFMGSFLFALVFMATDPVTATSTNAGKYLYGFLIGVVGMIIRVMNPAYPEGWMLAILFMNVFAPLIDHYVLQANISRRLKRATNA